jgi:serine/threonine protein kinase
MIGTFGYMAPEQLHGEATPATDIYSLAATLAALAAGTPADKLPRKGLVIDLAAVLPPSPLRDVLAAMLAPDPSQRLASAADVRRMLDRKLPGPQDRSPRQTPSQPPPAAARDLAARPETDRPRPVRHAAPAPQFVVWIWTLIAAGLFFAIEHIFIPLAFALAGLHPRYPRPAAASASASARPPRSWPSAASAAASRPSAAATTRTASPPARRRRLT